MRLPATMAAANTAPQSISSIERCSNASARGLTAPEGSLLKNFETYYLGNHCINNFVYELCCEFGLVLNIFNHNWMLSNFSGKRSEIEEFIYSFERVKMLFFLKTKKEWLDSQKNLSPLEKKKMLKHLLNHIKGGKTPVEARILGQLKQLLHIAGRIYHLIVILRENNPFDVERMDMLVNSFIQEVNVYNDLFKKIDRYSENLLHNTKNLTDDYKKNMLILATKMLKLERLLLTDDKLSEKENAEKKSINDDFKKIISTSFGRQFEKKPNSTLPTLFIEGKPFPDIDF